MTRHGNELPPPERMLFYFTGIRPLHCAPGQVCGLEPPPAYAMLIAAEGSGTVRLQGRTARLSKRQTIVLVPAAPAELVVARQSVSGYRIDFEVFVPGSAGPGNVPLLSGLPFAGELAVKPAKPLLRAAQELHRHRQLPEPDPFKAQMLFHELLHLLLRKREQEQEQEQGPAEPERAAGPETPSAIERAIAHMEAHYDDDLTREALAAVAEMSPGHFSTFFRRHTGSSPSRYLTAIRMRRARELLLFSACRLKDVSQRVGYADPFYFSRAFKSDAGVSPAAFIRRHSQRIAVLSASYTHNLLALRVLPCATVLDEYHSENNGRIPYSIRGLETPDRMAGDIEKLRETAPALILGHDRLDAGIQAELRRIAPLVTLSWQENDWREHLRRIAELAGKETEADGWLARYDSASGKLAKSIRRAIGDDTLAIMRVKGTELRVYGDRNVGAVFYRDLGIAAPFDLRAVGVFREIAPEELPAYDADRILLLTDRDPVSARTSERLQRSAPWNRLAAVRSRSIHQAHTNRWLSYSAWTHERLLTMAARWLT